MVQNVTKDSMAFPVPRQLITNETETIARRKIPHIHTEQTFHPDLIYRPFPRPLQNYDHTVQKISQTLSPE